MQSSFTVPPADFLLPGVLKEPGFRFQAPDKKSDSLRAGLQALDAMTPTKPRQALEQLATFETGRPKRINGRRVEPAWPVRRARPDRVVLVIAGLCRSIGVAIEQHQFDGAHDDVQVEPQ